MQLRIFLFLTLFISLSSPALAADRLVIASAAGPLPGQSLPALTLAMAKGVTELALRVSTTADSTLLLLSDDDLNLASDAARLFPDRQQDDGTFRANDFSLEEIRQLRLHPESEDDKWPSPSVAIPTLAEALALIRRLEEHLTLPLSIFLEIDASVAQPTAGNGALLLDTLAQFGYLDRQSRLLIACSDPDTLQRLHQQLLPERQMDLPLLQLLAGNPEGDTGTSAAPSSWLFSNSGLRIVAGYAWGIAAPAATIAGHDENGQAIGALAGYFAEAKRYGLHRLAQLPAAATMEEEELLKLTNTLFDQLELDGVYTDAYQAISRHRQRLVEEAARQADLPPFFSELELKRPAPKEELQEY